MACKGWFLSGVEVINWRFRMSSLQSVSSILCLYQIKSDFQSPKPLLK
jgi:hypothetical protein